MQILTETNVYMVSFSQSIDIHSYSEKLLAENISIVSQAQITLKAHHESHPIIWLLIFDSFEQITNTDFRKHHANNESFVFLIKNPETTHPLQSKYKSLPFSCSLEQLQQTLLSQEQAILQRNIFRDHEVEDELFLQQKLYGRSAVFNETKDVVRCVATTDECVFIKGETGTGKELTARSIHYLSDRNNAPFIPINCGAFNDDLILSELFGYEKGAFTGAIKAKKGLLEIADSGTVFLDEVDSLSLKAQVALLRFLQDDEIRPIGSHTIKKVNVRVVAASNKNLKTLIAQEKFRDDLYYRLDVLTVCLPSLKQRGEDTLLLAQYFLAELAINNDNVSKVFSQSVIDAIKEYEWPGNIRELQNFITRAYVLTKTSIIDNSDLILGTPIAHLPDGTLKTEPVALTRSWNEEKEMVVRQFEKKYLHQALKKTHGNISKAASIAKKERRSFCRLMQKYGLERKSYIGI
jgi:transcriptional regulator with PAS, ATPase and Fis domain